MRALGLVNRTVREINEMRYEFDEPFVVDASRAETELGLRATPLTDAVERTVRWYREQAIPSSAADQKRTEQVAPGRSRDRALPYPGVARQSSRPRGDPRR
jgi:dTDP-D-glucose 4,6-dehydratase